MDSKKHGIIRKFNSLHDQEKAAILIARTEPWKTYERDYNVCLDMVQDSSKEVYGYFSSNEFAGIVIFDLKGSLSGYIKTLCVTEEYRGQGIGKKLVGFAEEIIWNISPNIFVCYSDIDKRPFGFYKHLGYKFVGELEDYNIKNHPEYLMRKSLCPKSDYFKRTEKGRKYL